MVLFAVEMANRLTYLVPEFKSKLIQCKSLEIGNTRLGRRNNEYQYYTVASYGFLMVVYRTYMNKLFKEYLCLDSNTPM